MLTMERVKSLTPVALSASMRSRAGMLRDVNKGWATAGRNCVSPINAQDSSNLKIQKFISLEKTGFADMYLVPRRQAFSQRGGNAKVPNLT
jgi:hypothetical protein